MASMAAVTSAKAAGRSSFKLASSQRGIAGKLPPHSSCYSQLLCHLAILLHPYIAIRHSDTFAPVEVQLLLTPTLRLCPHL